MARNYIVVLDSKPAGNTWPYPEDYFPRGYHYTGDANDLVAEVAGKGGKAHVVPKSQATPDLIRQCEGNYQGIIQRVREELKVVNAAARAHTDAAAVAAADTLSHTALLDAAKEGAALGTCDDDT